MLRRSIRVTDDVACNLPNQRTFVDPVPLRPAVCAAVPDASSAVSKNHLPALVRRAAAQPLPIQTPEPFLAGNICSGDKRTEGAHGSRALFHRAWQRAVAPGAGV